MDSESTRVPAGQDISEKRIKELSEINSTYEAANLARMVVALRSELAAIRDAGDEEIDVASKALHSPNSFERHCFAERLVDIAKARGARVRELEEDIGCYEAMKEGFSSRLADVEKERDEAIYLLRWLRRLAEGKHIEFRDGTGHAETNRLLELTAKREGE